MEPNEKLIDRRNKLKMTQEDVANKARISRAYYVNIERGRRSPSLEIAKNIADALKTTVDRIFFNQGVPNRNKRDSA